MHRVDQLFSFRLLKFQIYLVIADLSYERSRHDLNYGVMIQIIKYYIKDKKRC